MIDLRPSLAEHQLTVIRAFLRARFPGAELIDRFDAEATAHRFTLDPGRTSKRTLLVPGALRLTQDLYAHVYAHVFSRVKVDAMRRLGASMPSSNLPAEPAESAGNTN
jgi:hypothetical protein